jgi:hypothetical protein
MRPASAATVGRDLPGRARLEAFERRIARYEPWAVLGPIVVAQWLALVVFALVVRHNGWLFYQGGDQTVFYTDGWALGHGHIPEAEIGYGWSYVLAPIAGIFGSNLLGALPAIVLFQTIVLLPIAICCVYGIAARIGGRLLGYFAAALWVAAPFLSIPLWDHRYHAKFIEQFLPQAFGMTGMGDFPSMVALLVAGYFCIRALDTADLTDGALGGLAAGFAIGIKPANALFLAGPLLGFAAARRWREGAAFGVAIVPELLALALWKYRGLGHLPVITPAPKALAAGAGAVAGAGLPLGLVVSRYFHFDWWRMHQNYLELREFFWSVRLLEWLPIAGFIAAARRSWPKALLLAGWIGAFIVVKGSSTAGSIESGILLRLFLPGFAPFLIFTALIPLLIPAVGPRIWARFPLRTWSFPHRRRPAVAAAVVFALVPVLLFAVLRPLRGTAAVKDFQYYVLVPADKAFAVDVRRTPNGAGELVSWKPPSSSASVFYRVYRSRPTVAAPDPTLPPGRDGIRCLPPNTYGHPGASDCRLEMPLIGVTRDHSFVDHPPAGAWTYRIGLTANWLNDTTRGDTMVLSAPGHLGRFH